MAGAKPGIHKLQLKSVCVPGALQNGDKFMKWEEVSKRIKNPVQNRLFIIVTILVELHCYKLRLRTPFSDIRIEQTGFLVVHFNYNQ